MAMPRDIPLDLVANVPTEVGAIGKFIGIIEAPTAALDVRIDGQTALRRGPGGSILLSEPFKRCTLTSSTTQTVRVLIADEVQDVSNITTSGSGSGATPIVDTPSDTIVTAADNNVADGTTENIAADLTRRRITVGVLSTSAGPIRVQAVGSGDASGVEIAPGMSYRFDTTASLDLHAPAGGGGADVWTLVESGP